MLGAMLKHPRSICPSHAQKCYVRTQRTQLTHVMEPTHKYLKFLMRQNLWKLRILLDG